jgi:hypothetical protein
MPNPDAPAANAPLIQWTQDEFFKLAAKVDSQPQTVQVVLNLLQARLITVAMFKQLLDLTEPTPRL